MEEFIIQLHCVNLLNSNIVLELQLLTIVFTVESTNRDVLLYGGNDSDDNNRGKIFFIYLFNVINFKLILNTTAIVNYCYTLNLDTYAWKQQNIVAARGTALIRTRHSGIDLHNSLNV